ncbi:permease [Devosia sp.]|uniref:permease n=1 Tax=Devosia sp. TaxID=1871048 RepID=UPI001AD2F171|nr:permease [Devosia sp.]MBN9333780.1 permease [Devosia sp.]
MDFMKLLKSLEELLYELISWFLFYPLTLWRIVRRPLQMLSYAERQLLEDEDRQFDDSLSPPILLLISLVVLHSFGQILQPEEDHALSGLLADDWNLLIFRAVSFSLFPLLFGLLQLKLNKARLTRTTFKPVFYSQCYAAVPFVVAVSLGLQGMTSGEVILGGVVAMAGLLWYATSETLWLIRSARLRPLKATLAVAATLIVAIPLFLLSALVVGLASGSVAIPN